MKKFMLLCVVLFICTRGMAQFVTMPLNYPDDGTAYMSWFTSIVDENTVWIGTIHEGFNGYLPYSDAVKTSDGGNTWQFSTIPVPGTPWIQHLSAWDENICYYLFIDGTTYEGAVWKTSNGGSAWSRMTTTQFAGGWPNSVHAFSADTVVVIGDPNGGYFEIQITYDGGNNWIRVPQANLPDPLAGEWGVQGNYYAVGNTIGFGTSHGRCIRSNDRGLHWTATQVVDEYMAFSFSDSLHGVGFRPGTTKGFFQTIDGGNTWSGVANPFPFQFGSMSNIQGIYGGFVVTAMDTLNTDSLFVFFTTDFFETASIIDSNITNATNINFKDPSNGWLGGSYFWYHNIHKYIGVLSSLPEPISEPGSLSVSPNPTRDAAFVRVPESWAGRKSDLYVCNLTGKVIVQRNYEKLPELIYLNATGMPDGLYIIRVITPQGEHLARKWVISR